MSDELTNKIKTAIKSNTLNNDVISLIVLILTYTCTRICKNTKINTYSL